MTLSSSERLEHEQRPDSLGQTPEPADRAPDVPGPAAHSPGPSTDSVGQRPAAAGQPAVTEQPPHEGPLARNERSRDAKEVPAAVRYKEITATAVSAAERMRKIESERIADLADEVAAGRERIAESEQRRDDLVEGVQVRWDSAREALWDERWMRVPPMPPADTSAAPASPDESLRSVQSAYLALREAIGKRRWSAGTRKAPRRDRGEE